MHSVIKSAILRSSFSYLLGLIEEGRFYFRSELVVHSYREIGTAVEVAIEIRFFNKENKIIKAKLTNIKL